MSNSKSIVLGAAIIALAVVFGPVIRGSLVTPARADLSSEADAALQVYLKAIADNIRGIKACRE